MSKQMVQRLAIMTKEEREKLKRRVLALFRRADVQARAFDKKVSNRRDPSKDKIMSLDTDATRLLKKLKKLDHYQRTGIKRRLLKVFHKAEGPKPTRYDQPQLKIIDGGRP
jgi:hypothetical protein